MLHLGGSACLSAIYVTAWTNGFSLRVWVGMHVLLRAPLTMTNGAPGQRKCVIGMLLYSNPGRKGKKFHHIFLLSLDFET